MTDRKNARLFTAAAAFAGALSLSSFASAAASFAPLTTFGATVNAGDGFIAAGEAGSPVSASAATERGVAYNTSTNNVYVVSRASGNQVRILNGDTGVTSQTVTLPSGVTEGVFPVNLIRVADDGAIYISNLTTTADNLTNSFRIYRFQNEAALTTGAFTLAYEGAPSAHRYGDSFNVRGGGTSTQFIAGGGTGNANVAIFTSANGLDYTANLNSLAYTVPNEPSNSNGLADAANGVAFGEGNSIYVKQVGDYLRLFSFTPGANNSLVFQDASLPGGATGPFGRIAAIDTDIPNDLLAGLSLPAPGADSARLYDIANPLVDPTQLDFETLPVDFANTNVAGSLDFGNNRLYVLDSQNGLLALQVTVPEPAGLLGVACLGGLFLRRRRA